MARTGRLEGRGCLIVGGTSGIGLATARRFLEEGARVMVSGKTPQERQGALELLQHHGPVQAFAAQDVQLANQRGRRRGKPLGDPQRERVERHVDGP